MKTSADLERIIQARAMELREQSDYRMKNYFNCIDDYAFGGIQDQIASEEMSRLRHLRDKLKNQEENGGYLIETAKEFCLYKDGVLVSSKIVNTRFGKCFVFGGGFNPQTEEYDQPTFVSIPKKIETLNKKGFGLICNQYTFKVIYDGMQNSKFDTRKIEVLSVEKIDFDLKDRFIGDDNQYNTNLWFSKQLS